MKKIYCDIHLFDLHQRVYMMDTDAPDAAVCVAVSTVAKLPEILATLSATKNVNTIMLQGNKEYGKFISKEIKDYALNNYNKNNIEIEVI